MTESTRRRTLRLRTRVTLFFSLTALVASLGLAVVTYAVSRSFLIEQRQQTARAQAYANAKTVKDQYHPDVVISLDGAWRHEERALRPQEQVVLSPVQFTRDGEPAPRDLRARRLTIACRQGRASVELR